MRREPLPTDGEQWAMRFGILFRPHDPPGAANIVRRWQEVLDASRLAEIGTTVHLLPFEHPIHVAEHAAMADVRAAR